jgi:uncharacterized protein
MGFDWIYTALPWAGYLLLLGACAAGLLINLVGLPGIWIMILAAMGFAIAWNEHLGWTPVLVCVGFGLIAEVCEFVAGAAGAKSAGGTKRGMAGAIIGGIVGAIAGSILIPIPLVGTIIGAIVGTGLGAFFIEWGWVGAAGSQATTIAYGAAKGRLIGMILKSVFGAIIAAILIVTAFPWGRSASTPAPTTVPTSMPATQSQ